MGCGRERFVESALSDICHTRCNITMAANHPTTPTSQASHQPSPPSITWLDSLIWLFPEENPPSSSGCCSAASARRRSATVCLAQSENAKMCYYPIRLPPFFSFFARIPSLVYSFIPSFIYSFFGCLHQWVCVFPRLEKRARESEGERKEERKFPLSEHFALQLENFNWALGAATLIRPSP